MENLQRGKKWHEKNNQTEGKTVSRRETVRKNSKTKRNLPNFKISGAEKQKEFSIEYILKNKNGLSFGHCL